MYTTRDDRNYTFQLNDNRLEVVYNGWANNKYTRNSGN
jgi:hypothetical protein